VPKSLKLFTSVEKIRAYATTPHCVEIAAHPYLSRPQPLSAPSDGSPCSRTIRIPLTVRKLTCRHPSWARLIFTERPPDLVAPHAWKTTHASPPGCLGMEYSPHNLSTKAETCKGLWR
jgi:hypothetical protein